MKKLPIRPIPYKDESLISFIKRITERNKFPDTFSTLELAGLTNRNEPQNLTMITNHNVSMERLCFLSGVSIFDLINLTFYYDFGQLLDERTHEVQAIFRFGLKTKYNQVCPLCIRQKAYLRKRWDIGFYTCCHLHKCLLINKCPKCNKKLTMNSFKITLCKCGYDLSLASVKQVSVEETELSALISAKLNGIMEEGLPYNPLRRMDLLSILYIMLRFSLQIANYIFNVKRFAFSKDLEIEKIHEISFYVFKVFSNWPTSFTKFLEEFRKPSKDSSKETGLQKEFGRLYDLYNEHLQTETYHEIGVQFEKYLLNEWDGGVLFERIIRKIGSSDKKVFLPGNEAIKELGVSHSRLTELIESKAIEGIIVKRRTNDLILVRVESLESYKMEMDNYISLAETSIILGVSVRMTRIFLIFNLMKSISGQEVDEKFWKIIKVV